MSFIEFGFIVTIFVAALGIYISHKLKLPSSIGLILIGLLLGPAFLKIVSGSDTITFLANLGLTLLIFKIGLESDFSIFFSRKILTVGFFSILVPWFFGYVTAWFLGFSSIQAFFIGVILATSSTSVVVGILSDMNLLEREFAQIIIGAMVFTDVLGLTALTVATTVVQTQAFDFYSIIDRLTLPILIMTSSIFFGFLILEVLKKIRKTPTNEGILDLLIVGMALLFATLSEEVGFSAIVGAMLVGLVIQRTGIYRERLEKLVNPLIFIFAPMFFINLGLLIKFGALVSGLFLGVLLTVITIGAQFIGTYYSAKTSGVEELDSLLVSFGMLPRGEVSLVGAQIGLALGVLTSEIFSAVVVMSLITSLIPALIFFHILTPYNYAKTRLEVGLFSERILNKLKILSAIKEKMFAFVRKIKYKLFGI